MSENGKQQPPKTTYLVEQAQGKNKKALDQLFERYSPRVYRIVALRLGKRAREFGDVEDVAQEALIKVLKDLKQYEKESEAKFRNWVSTIVTNTIRDYLRHAKAAKRGGGTVRRFTECRIDNLADLILPSKDKRPSEIAQACELESLVEDAVLGLSEHHREIIILRHVCEMSHKEIGETIALNENAARQACSRAITKLKEALGA